MICVFLLQQIFGILRVVDISAFLPFTLMPGFLLYLGVFVIVENFLWTYVFEHF
ncbi:hypothetical protein HY640_03955 [Candidatus Woesearchaeota archaeon]|nr:hypothetical protein [Candidatus Woesearchaeota archaeon]